MISEMSAHSDSWGPLSCDLGSLTIAAEGNVHFGRTSSTFLDPWLTFWISEYQMSHLLISRSCLTSQYSFLFFCKSNSRKCFCERLMGMRRLSGARVRPLQLPTPSRLGWTIQGKFMQMLPGQCQPPRPGPTWSSLPDVPGACAVPELPSCR